MLDSYVIKESMKLTITPKKISILQVKIQPINKRWQKYINSNFTIDKNTEKIIVKIPLEKINVSLKLKLIQKNNQKKNK